GRCRLAVAERESAWVCALRGLCAGSRRLVCVHFGVGGNDKKRAGLDLETELLEWLVRRGYRVLLARGASPDEIDESYRLCRRVADRGIAITHLPPGCELDGLAGREADILTWEA